VVPPSDLATTPWNLRDRRPALGSNRIGPASRWLRLARLSWWPQLPSKFETNFANALVAKRWGLRGGASANPPRREGPWLREPPPRPRASLLEISWRAAEPGTNRRLHRFVAVFLQPRPWLRWPSHAEPGASLDVSLPGGAYSRSRRQRALVGQAGSPVHQGPDLPRSPS